MRLFSRSTVLATLISAFIFVGSAFTVLAITSATISFLDPGNQPQYLVTGTGPTEDQPGCDFVTMFIADATGGILDVDTFCLDTGTGTGSDFTDWGSHESGYFVPAQNPITYALFDTSGADACSADENSIACSNFLLGGGAACITETYLEADLVPAGLAAQQLGVPYSVCGTPEVPAGPVTSCRLTFPDGSVVGEAPLGAQIYYEPGNIAPGYIANPGTYIVVGQDESETYYQIVLSCQLVWVRKDTMQPSFLPPQNGTPLPTRIVE